MWRIVTRRSPPTLPRGTKTCAVPRVRPRPPSAGWRLSCARPWGRRGGRSTRGVRWWLPAPCTPGGRWTPSGCVPTTPTSWRRTPPRPQWTPFDHPERTAVSRISNAVAQRQNTLTALIERQKPEIARALPKHMDPDRLARIATTVLRQTPQLGQCTPESFLGALMTCAQLGLEPGPLGHAYLVPFKNNKTGMFEVTFIPGYRGLVELARRSGQVQSVQAHVVREGDRFDYEFGLNPKLEHKPAGSDGEVTHAYAV